MEGDEDIDADDTSSEFDSDSIEVGNTDGARMSDTGLNEETNGTDNVDNDDVDEDEEDDNDDDEAAVCEAVEVDS